MKMPVRLLSLVLALLLTFPGAAFAEINFDDYSVEELIALKTQISSEITARTNAKNVVTVPMGEYIIGVDIPSGTYTLTGNRSFTSIYIYSSNDKCLGSHTLYDGSNTIGKIVLQEGQRIEITFGPITFSPYKGLGF